MDTIVVIPTYNEADNVTPIADAVQQNAPGVEILFVDDNSPDGTGAICDRLAGERDEVHVLHRAEKSGLGRAYIEGFHWALARSYTYICEMDADFSHDPKDLVRLQQTAQQADIALGSRYIGGIRIIN